MNYFSGKLDQEPEIRAALRAIRNLFMGELSGSKLPRIVFNATMSVQLLARRSIELVDGMNLGWRADNMLTFVTMGRSLIETAALVYALYEEVSAAISEKDLQKIDDSISGVLMGSKHELFNKAVQLNPKNVLTLIDRFDRHFLDSKKKVVRDAYEFLCEFVHPNGPSLNFLHGEFKRGEARFRVTAERKQMIWDQVKFALALLPVISDCLEKLSASLGEIQGIVELVEGEGH